MILICHLLLSVKLINIKNAAYRRLKEVYNYLYLSVTQTKDLHYEP